VNASSMSDLRKIYTTAKETDQELPVALVIGADPGVLMAAAGKPPSTVSEYAVTGALHKKPLEVVKCENSDLLVPADAEIVIEGVIDFSEEVEQTLGEFAGQYGPETNPIFRVTAITHRKDASFYAITAGANPEHNTVGSVAIYAIEQAILEDLQKQFPNIIRAHVVIEARIAGPMLQLFLTIEKKDNEEPMKLIEAAFKSTAGYLPVSMIFKRIVIVDPDIDIYDYNDVEWAVWTRVAEKSKIMVSEAVSWELERGTKDGKSVRVGIDATMDLAEVEKLKRPIIPGFDQYPLEKYL
jgi:2,5-furandicarboxylate decarboxylase 1